MVINPAFHVIPLRLIADLPHPKCSRASTGSGDVGQQFHTGHWPALQPENYRRTCTMALVTQQKGRLHWGGALSITRRELRARLAWLAHMRMQAGVH